MSKTRKSIALILSLIMLSVSITACQDEQVASYETAKASAEITAESSDAIKETGIGEKEVKSPKYIFLFIGDGLSFPQVSALGLFNGTVENNFVGTLAEPTPDNMPEASMPSFVKFPVVGAASTYDASKFITDSASAATAIACSVKTLDGAIGVDTYNNQVESVAEILREKTYYQIGILSSVSLNHATLAGFYAHVANRNSYYDI